MYRIVTLAVVLPVFAGVVLLLVEYVATVSDQSQLRQAAEAGVREARLTQASSLTVRKVVRQRLRSTEFTRAPIVVEVAGRPASTADWLVSGDQVSVRLAAPGSRSGWLRWFFGSPPLLVAEASTIVP